MANKNLEALLATGLFTQVDVPEDLSVDYSDQSLYEDDLIGLPNEKESYTPEELRTFLISDLNSLYGVTDAV